MDAISKVDLDLLYRSRDTKMGPTNFEISATASEVNSVPEDIEQTIQDLLLKKQRMIDQWLTLQEDNLILNELMKYPNAWVHVMNTEKQGVSSNEVDISSEMNAILDKRMGQMNETTDIATKVVNTLNNKLDVLSQKNKELETKQCGVEGVEPQFHALNLHHIDVQNTLEKINVLWTTAQANANLCKGRLERLRDSLHHLQDTRSLLESRHLMSKNQLSCAYQDQNDLQNLCGLECSLQDDCSLKVSLQVKDMIHASNLGEKDLDDLKCTATLKFDMNGQNSLEVSDVQTNPKVEKVNTLIEKVIKDQDLPKFMMDLRNTWLSHLPLNAELCFLRKRHAIDYIAEQDMLQLIVNNGDTMCRLHIPKSYPHADVTLINVTGPSGVKINEIGAPHIKSITHWIKYLEDALGVDGFNSD